MMKIKGTIKQRPLQNRQHTYQSTGQTCASSRLLVVYMKILENYDFHPSRWLSISCLILPVDMGSVH